MLKVRMARFSAVAKASCSSSEAVSFPGSSTLGIILLIVGLLYTVRVSLRGQALAPEPFLLGGLISVIRRVLILSAKFGNWHEKTASESQHIMIELAVSTVLLLILSVSLMLLRKASAPAVANRG